MKLLLKKVTDAGRWNQLLTQDLDGHLLQSWEWGQFKERFGWEADYLAWENDQDKTFAAGLILKRSIVSNFSILYCPRGPILNWSNDELVSSVLSELQSYSKSKGAIFLKIDPDVALGCAKVEGGEEKADSMGESLRSQLMHHGWIPSVEQIQFRNSMHLNLLRSEDELLDGMKQKTRYNIRLAEKRGVIIREGSYEDLDLLYRMYAETSLRDHFTIRDQIYYQDAWGTFLKSSMAQPFIAEVEGEPIAGIIIFYYGKRAIYMYGMSREIHRDKMPSHLLQWAAIKWAKAKGYTLYDFWGAPDTFTANDPMWGVYRFKSGFGADVIRTLGAWDYVGRSALYKIYSVVLPRIMSLMRRVGRTRTAQSLE